MLLAAVAQQVLLSKLGLSVAPSDVNIRASEGILELYRCTMDSTAMKKLLGIQMSADSHLEIGYLILSSMSKELVLDNVRLGIGFTTKEEESTSRKAMLEAVEALLAKSSPSVLLAATDWTIRLRCVHFRLEIQDESKYRSLCGFWRELIISPAKKQEDIFSRVFDCSNAVLYAPPASSRSYLRHQALAAASAVYDAGYTLRVHVAIYGLRKVQTMFSGYYTASLVVVLSDQDTKHPFFQSTKQKLDPVHNDCLLFAAWPAEAPESCRLIVSLHSASVVSEEVVAELKLNFPQSIHATARVASSGRIAASIAQVKDRQRPDHTFFKAPFSQLKIDLSRDHGHHNYEEETDDALPRFLDHTLNRAHVSYSLLDARNGDLPALRLNDEHLFQFLRTLDAHFAKQVRVSINNTQHILNRAAAMLRAEAQVSAGIISKNEKKTRRPMNWALTILSVTCTNAPCDRIVVCLSSANKSTFAARTSRPARLQIQASSTPIASLGNTPLQSANEGNARFIQDQEKKQVASDKLEAVILDTFEEASAPAMMSIAVADPDHAMAPLFGPRILASATVQLTNSSEQRDIVLKPCTNSMFFFLDYVQDQSSLSTSIIKKEQIQQHSNQHDFKLRVRLGQPTTDIIASPRHVFRDRDSLHIPWHLEMQATAPQLIVSHDHSLKRAHMHLSWQKKVWNFSGAADSFMKNDGTTSSEYPTFQASSDTGFEARLKNSEVSSMKFLKQLALIRTYFRRCFQHFMSIRANRFADLDALDRTLASSKHGALPFPPPHSPCASSTRDGGQTSDHHVLAVGTTDSTRDATKSISSPASAADPTTTPAGKNKMPPPRSSYLSAAAARIWSH